jgi:Tfp pilus assembly protein PilF
VYGSAIDKLHRAFTLDSSSADAYNDLGWALVQNGQSRDALQLLERGIARFPGEARLAKNAGLAALDLGDTRTAIVHLDAALRLDPSLTEATELRQRALAGATPPAPPGAPATP